MGIFERIYENSSYAAAERLKQHTKNVYFFPQFHKSIFQCNNPFRSILRQYDFNAQFFTNKLKTFWSNFLSNWCQLTQINLINLI